MPIFSADPAASPEAQGAWTTQTSGTPQRLYGVARKGSQWVTVGGSGTVLTSLTV